MSRWGHNKSMAASPMCLSRASRLPFLSQPSPCRCHLAAAIPHLSVLLTAAFLSLSFFTSITTRLPPQTGHCRHSSLLSACYQTQILSPLAFQQACLALLSSPLKTENIQKRSRVSYPSLWLRFSVASFLSASLTCCVLQTSGPEL